VDFGEQAFEIRDSLSLLKKEITMRFANDVLVGPALVSPARTMFNSCRIEPEGLAAEKRMFASRKMRISPAYRSPLPRKNSSSSFSDRSNSAIRSGL
jgi:hypothetical protein